MLAGRRHQTCRHFPPEDYAEKYARSSIAARMASGSLVAALMGVASICINYGRRSVMTGLEWVLAMSLFMLYITCIFTVCSMTFQKGHTLLGILGIFIPLLWLIGAMLPAKSGSRYDVTEAERYRAQVDYLTR
jgi:hypothetical protein